MKIFFGSTPGVGNNSPSDYLSLGQVDDGQVFIVVVHVGKQEKGVPFASSQELPDFLVDVDAGESFSSLRVHRNDIGVP